MDFEWSIKTENETEILYEPSTSDTDSVSFLTIDDDRARTYRCVANNSVGVGTMCSIEITGMYFQMISNIILSLFSGIYYKNMV